MQAYFSDHREAIRTGVPGLTTEQVAELFGRKNMTPAGTPIVLDAQIRPVEPLCSWLRHLGLGGHDSLIEAVAGACSTYRLQCGGFSPAVDQ